MIKQLLLILLFQGALATILKASDEPNLAGASIDYQGAAHLSDTSLGSLLIGKDKYERKIQVRALSQSSVGSDRSLRGSSCEYHAFRNGVMIAQALINAQMADHYLGRLGSNEEADRLLGKASSPLRISIIEQRFAPTARRVIRKLVNDALAPKESDDLKVRFQDELELIKNGIRVMNPSVVDNPEVSEHGLRYRATKADIYAALLERITTHTASGFTGTHQQHYSPQRLDQYFGDFEIDFTINFDGSCSEQLGRVDEDTRGEWVRTEEIPSMVEKQRKSGLLETLPGLIVTTYGDNLGGYEEHAYVSDTFSELYSTICSTRKDCVAVVLVYESGNSSSYKKKTTSLFSWLWGWFDKPKEKSFKESAEEVQSNQDYGHWVTLVVSRINGDMRYYLLDSLSNSSRLEDRRINEIIDILDGKKRLSGLRWTKRQAAAQGTRIENRTTRVTAGSGSGTRFLIGAVAAGLVAYLVYRESSRKKEQNRS